MSLDVRDRILEGARFLERGDLVSAERIVASLADDPDALHLLALVRIRQERLDDAVGLLTRSLAARPDHPQMLLNLGKVLVLLKNDAAAAGSLENSVAADPHLVEAWYALGELRQRAARLGDAEDCFRKLLAHEPRHEFALLSLGIVLKETGRAAEAETMLADGFSRATDALMKAAFAYNRALAQYDQGKKEAALENFTLVGQLDPGRGTVDLTRADLLEELLRYDEAVALLEDLLKREPMNEAAHAAYNQLLHRLGRDGEFLKSYDRVGSNAPLEIGKADLLLRTGRQEEAHEIFAGVAAREPDNLDAAIGAATALNQLGRHGEAMRQLERASRYHPENLPLCHRLASTALQDRDPEKAAALAEKSLKRAPLDQFGLAVLGSAWRMMGDERDEVLNGYDDLIRVFDLDPPEGFSDMGEFNLALNAWLDRMHPETREPLHQSLRSGSQTRGRIFGAGHDLAERLKTRIAEAVERYVAETRPDPRHPFRGRVGQGLRFTGSWSSRLRDCGYHINHVHPEGWISSCYYVGVPDAVKDENAKEGWIKFGEPGFEVGLAPRRAIQPAPGRLVLFPSYMWHGTIPFRSASARTTIAFDAVPRG